MRLQLLSILIFLIFFYGCSGPVAFKTSEITPAATGSVKVKENKNGNYTVEMEVQNLAPADKLKPSRKYYVVWAKSSEGEFNLGRLELDKEMSGTFSGQSTYQPKRIFISAEDDEKETRAGKQIVLETKKL